MDLSTLIREVYVYSIHVDYTETHNWSTYKEKNTRTA